jgi:hypothetical protein
MNDPMNPQSKITSVAMMMTTPNEIATPIKFSEHQRILQYIFD